VRTAARALELARGQARQQLLGTSGFTTVARNQWVRQAPVAKSLPLFSVGPILGVDTHYTAGCTVQAELCAHCVMLPNVPELLRRLRLYWRREMLMSG
jgi:hypothetical protein